MMKLSLLSSVVWFIGSMVHAATAAGDANLFSVETTSTDWDACAVQYSSTCEPTVSIEQAACEAPLIVYGLVLTDDPNNGQVQIQVEYQSQAYGEDQPKGVAKWGAGLNQDDSNSIFYMNSGTFTTFVSGFTNSSNPLPCGTKEPDVQSEGYFFLKALPSYNGEAATINSDTGALNLNFELSTTVLGSGMVPSNLEAWDIVQSGILNQERLNGNCRPIYCCYNPKCEDCQSLLQGAGVSCKWTTVDMGSSTQSSSPPASNGLWSAAYMLLIVAFYISWL